jgi:hypothetical protein
MKELKRQDKNGVRHASDIERKYKLGTIDYTAEEIEKLKMQIIVDSSLSTSSVHPVQNKVVTKALNSKVNQEKGKELSSNDFTDDEKNKLKNIPTNAEENIIESISVNGVQQEIINKNVDLQISSSVLNASEYSFYIVTTENISIIPITYDQYSDGDIVDVYINGMKLIKGLHFSISANNIVLTNTVDVVGTEIEIVIKKYN